MSFLFITNNCNLCVTNAKKQKINEIKSFNLQAKKKKKIIKQTKK